MIIIESLFEVIEDRYYLLKWELRNRWEKFRGRPHWMVPTDEIQFPQYTSTNVEVDIFEMDEPRTKD